MRPAEAGVTVGLAMIVKNEGATLPRLAATLDGVLDHWTVVDTGSSDATVAVAREVFDGVPGTVIEDEWRGYGPSRNVALEAARPHTDWVLTLDADDTFHGVMERSVPSDVNVVEAAYLMPPLRFWLPRLVRSADPWRWFGRAHEYLAIPGVEPARFRTGAFEVEHHADGGNRSTKFRRELALLREDYRENPADPRTVFYLARTYEDGGEQARAATWYRKRLALTGWDEETWYARWRLGVCLLTTARPEEGCGVLWAAWGSRPWRAEPLWSLAEHYRITAQWALCQEVCELARRRCGVGAPQSDPPYGGDRLFVHTDVYDWRILYEESISAYYADQRDRGAALVSGLLARTDIPPAIRENLEANRRFYNT
ncbi:MAG: tetratricopeptide repeat-containing glycosyltransferase [Acidimicrobiales bacterium]